MEDLYTRSRRDLFFIMGPCALESRELALTVAESLSNLASKFGVTVVFKSSFDKANRTSINSFRGPGMALGLSWLAEVRERFGLPILTDIHLPEQAVPVGEVVDVIQIPAFLCRQTDILAAAAGTGKIVNVKKGQFLAPWDMKAVVGKLAGHGCSRIWCTERGSSFGYNNLVVDYRSLPVLAGLGHPVVFDATHSVQLPGGLGHASGGQRELVPVLARAAVAAGVHGVFMEVHPAPDQALCDGANSWPLGRVGELIRLLMDIYHVVRGASDDS
ncbi:MAG: 3-deoxy-8-phosphooctulonate synthase [Deltaproteobacteria bacterium]|nr:3-deoxy-8-phosphooctulonate synthase [Deltaproteobacteria bacterium]